MLKQIIKNRRSIFPNQFSGKEVSKEVLNVKDRTKGGFIEAAKSVNY